MELVAACHKVKYRTVIDSCTHVGRGEVSSLSVWTHLLLPYSYGKMWHSLVYENENESCCSSFYGLDYKASLGVTL